MTSNAELILEGFICQGCGELIDGDDPGYPRDCESCESYSRAYKGI